MLLEKISDESARRGRGSSNERQSKINYSSKLAGKKVLIIWGKYKLDTLLQKCTTFIPQSAWWRCALLPFPKPVAGVVDSSRLATSVISLTVNNHLYFQLALLIRRWRHCTRAVKKKRKEKESAGETAEWGAREKK